MHSSDLPSITITFNCLRDCFPFSLSLVQRDREREREPFVAFISIRRVVFYTRFAAHRSICCGGGSSRSEYIRM